MYFFHLLVHIWHVDASRWYQAYYWSIKWIFLRKTNNIIYCFDIITQTSRFYPINYSLRDISNRWWETTCFASKTHQMMPYMDTHLSINLILYQIHHCIITLFFSGKWVLILLASNKSSPQSWQLSERPIIAPFLVRTSPKRTWSTWCRIVRISTSTTSWWGRSAPKWCPQPLCLNFSSMAFRNSFQDQRWKCIQ